MRICGTDGQCTDDKTHLSDEDFNKRFRDDKNVRLKDGNIYKNGELIGTYENLGIDGAPFSGALMQAGQRPYERGVLAFGVASVLGGVTGGVGAYYGPVVVANIATRATTAVSIGRKIEKQLSKRGWTREEVERTVSQPHRTVQTRDTRHLPDGTRVNDPATAYVNRDGTYVIRNDRTGDVVQISNKNKPGWKPPF